MDTDEHRSEGVAKSTDVTLEVNRFLWKNLCPSVSICDFPSFLEFQLPDLGSRVGCDVPCSIAAGIRSGLPLL